MSGGVPPARAADRPDLSPAAAAAASAATPAAPLAARSLAALIGRGQTLAVVESLTGGALAAAIVDVPGASAAFRGGLVVYATDLKESLAGVPEVLLAAAGPVDPRVALAMADGGRRVCRADWALATTGVAGPEPQAGIPAGTAYVGLAGPAGQREVRRLRVTGDRARVRGESVTAALGLLWAHLR